MSKPLTTNQIPVCSCGSFLIYNFYFRNKRFLCLSCGSLFHGAPRIQGSSPAAEARYQALESEFLVNCGRKLFCFGLQRHDCELCNGPEEEEHIHHASKRDWIECNDALKWLSDRTGKEFGIVNGDLGHVDELKRLAMVTPVVQL